jgi:predicted ATPase/class 3 adenylate cyclase
MDYGHVCGDHCAMSHRVPRGTVTFLFTDIEGSTRLLHELGPERYADALGEHRRALRDVFGRHGGVEVDTQGDAFFYVFTDAAAAVAAAGAANEALSAGPIRVRVGIHTGMPLKTDEGYVGADVHLGARVAAAGHGGQVLLSAATRDHLDGGVTDLGEHRLKDFAEPVGIFQLGEERFPPLKTISNTNLPRPASSFVGRERETAAVAELVRGRRLVTLSGPGGSGKTRLAIEAAAEVTGEFKAGVFWIALAALHDPGLVPETIAQTLGAKDGLAAHIGERELLLLLDNLEQVIEAAPELASLVEACPNLHLLVTSREVLRVRGEVEYAVEPLAEPDSVALFCERSRLEPHEAIAELCRRLDNLPLAVELAAARTSVLSPVHILDRLAQRLDLLQGGRDADLRQKTLRATIEWSHDLLTAPEKQLFARLAVFRGGCTLDAAEAVAGADLDVLQSLVDKSLLRHTADRFWMLETIREYATEQLDEPEVAVRFVDHCVALAERAFPNLKGDPGEWLDLLEAEHDNMRAALERLESSGDTEQEMRLAGALYRFWYMRGHLAEGRKRIERLLAADNRPTPARARALHGAAVLAVSSSDPAISRTRSEEALALCRQLDDDWGVAYSIFLLATAATEEEDWSGALSLFEDARDRFRAAGDAHYTLLAGDGIAWMAYMLGDRERSRRTHEETLTEARGLGGVTVTVLQLDQLARFAEQDGRLDEAFAMLTEALELKLRTGLPAMVVESLVRFADAFAARGDQDTAALLAGAAESARREIGGGPTWVEQGIEALEDRLDPTAVERGRRLTMDEAVELALARGRPG